MVKVKELCNKVKKLRIMKTISRSIYAELLGWLAICIVFSIGCYFAIMIGLDSMHIAKVEHVDYEFDRVDTSSEVMEVINEVYTISDTSAQYRCLRQKIEQLGGESYITDESGVMLFGNEEDYVEGMKFDIEKWKKLAKLSSQEEREVMVVCYPLMIEGKVHYWLMKKQLEGVTTYTNEAIYTISATLAVLLFLILAFLGIRKKVKYLQYIGSCVKEIGRGNLTCEIKEFGSDELALIASNINEMEKNIQERMDKEQSLYKENRELVTNMSHDLKTPLTVLLGYLDILIKKQYHSEEERESYLQIAYEKTVSLHEMVLRLFSLVKNSNTNQLVDKVQFNLSRFLRQIIMEYEQVVKEKGLLISYDIPKEDICIMADAKKMQSIFDNLLGNSVKYCRENGAIAVTMEREKQSLHIQVMNDCLPMNQDELEHIFDKFYRADKARNSRIPGNGLGLSIVKENVIKHNGKIWAEWESGRIIFHIRMKIEKGE